MFRQLRLKFIGIATMSMFIVLALVLFLVNLITYRNAIAEVFSTLNFISEHSDTDFNDIDIKDKKYTPELQYETRYITMIVREDSALVSFNDDHIAAIDESEIEEFSSLVIDSKRPRGIFLYDKLMYAYLKKYQSNGEIKITIMDCTRNLSAVNFFIHFSVYVGLVSMLLLMLVLSIFARKAIQPIVRNMEAQKQFITNASHELKTPLAVIAANTEVIEMTSGKNEWTESTINQVAKMSDLISQMVVLSKLEERPDIVLSEVDFSGEVKKTVEDFKSVAETQGKTLETKVDDDISIKADDKGLHELVSILLDNAVKYCDDGGNISVRLYKKGKSAFFTVANDYSDGEGIDYSRFFERFYREDKSHNSEKKGYGIGLSMADSLTRMFKGRISVNYKKPVIKFTVVFGCV